MKRIVVCCDGTWQRPGQSFRGEKSPTNVARLAASVAKHDGQVPQITYYDQGVGTENVADVLGGGALGVGLDQNILEAYRFLVLNYEVGDAIYLFGFSRGAYTVRSLAGMIRKCGILRRELLLLETDAIELYRKRVDDVDADDESKSFRAENALHGDAPVPIQCVGVWDTVGALGIPGVLGLSGAFNLRYRFHDTSLSRHVKHAYHALSIDERRAPFEPTLWSPSHEADQQLEQAWFCGTHSDVGGGLGTNAKLSTVTLAWMFERAKRAGLALDPQAEQAFCIESDVTVAFNGLENLRAVDLVLGTTVRELGYVRDEATAEPVRDATQAVHESVRERARRVQTYRPDNLRVFDERERASR
ncbi:MAG: DUF2235 domain-containing protein [Polyangiales bacterium]